MWVKLKNEKETAFMNINFTVFFSVKGLQHKEALKQMINSFGCSIEDVTSWFETAINEFNTKKVDFVLCGSPTLPELMKNYEYFKKTYLPKEKINPMVKKINAYKPKFGVTSMLKKLVIQHDPNTIVMVDSSICLIYNKVGGVSIEEQYGTGNLSYFKNAVSKLVNDSTIGEIREDVSLNELKNIASTGFIQIGDSFFDVTPVTKFLNNKEKITVTFNKTFGVKSQPAMIFTQKNFIESTTIVLSAISCRIPDDAIIY